MNTRDNDPLHAPINAELGSIVEAAATRPAWYEGWMRLGPESTEEQRLAVYQAIRDSGYLPEEAGFYLVSWQIDAMTMTSISGPAPIGFLYSQEGGLWELIVYPKSVELVGGAEDGQIVSPGFSLDLEQLRGAFDRVDACSWESLGNPDDEGPHVSIEGGLPGARGLLEGAGVRPGGRRAGDEAGHDRTAARLTGWQGASLADGRTRWPASGPQVVDRHALSH